MPRLPINYDNTYFYKIVSRDLNIKDIDVGHTTDFKSRKRSHKGYCTNPNRSFYNTYVYNFINNGGWENFDVILIEQIKCEDKLHALKKEREYIESLNATLNTQIPTRTNKEWLNDNQEQRKEYELKYYQDNQIKIKQEKKTVTMRTKFIMLNN
jgi:hypothetical protein